MSAAEPIRSKEELHDLAGYYLAKGQARNYLLVMLGVYTALRIGDLLRLRWKDVYDGQRGRFRSHIRLTEQKTGKSKAVALNAQAVEALVLYARSLDPGERQPDQHLFASSRKSRNPISRVQAYRIIRAAAEECSLSGSVSCHSLRKTFGYHAWKSGAPVAVIMDIYNHSSMAITRRYLGISQDDKDQIYMQIDLR